MAHNVHLITSIGSSANPLRNEEFIYTQMMNLQNRHIEKIHILTEDERILSWFSSKKINVVLLPQRPLIRDIVTYANSLGNNVVVCIANGDILLDKTLSLVSFPDSNLVYSLTRWFPDFDVKTKRFEGISWWNDKSAYLSFDTWILKTPIYYVKNIGYPLGEMGSDNRFAYELMDSGKKLINPSKVIATYHVHASSARSYSEKNRVHGNYLGIEPSDSFDFRPEDIRKGWYEGGKELGVWPHLWSWISGIEDVEFWGRDDIPTEILYSNPVNKFTGKLRELPKSLQQAKSDWAAEFKRRCEEDPAYDAEGKWIG